MGEITRRLSFDAAASRIVVAGSLGVTLLLPVYGFAQTCATRPSSAPPPPIYRCLGGLCVDSIPDWSTASLPLEDWIELSAEHYNGYYGALTFSREQTTDGGSTISLWWNTQQNQTEVSNLQIVTPSQACPLYWVAAPPSAQGSGALDFQRFDNRGDATGAGGVPAWRHTHDRSIATIYATESSLYPGASAAVSPQYTTPSAACTSGFPSIQASVPAWSGATANYKSGVCVISKSNGTIATLPIQSYPMPQPPTTAVEYDVIRDDGQVLRYTVQNGVIKNPPGVSIRLAITVFGFTVTDDDDTVETYDAAGVLQSIESRAGVVQTLPESSERGTMFELWR